MRINLLAPFVLVHAVLPDMRAQGRGHIVTIGSVADRVVFPENGAYSASKFGARALHEVMRTELRGSGIRTTLVSPAATDTPIWDAVARAGEGRFPPRSAMLPSEAVADAVLFAVTQPERVNVDELRLSSA
jgi:NADP-dependent 3-hydroxy acid dehydrogenase YdfG